MVGKLDVLADFDTDKAKSCTILSRETVNALQELEKGPTINDFRTRGGCSMKK